MSGYYGLLDSRHPWRDGLTSRGARAGPPPTVEISEITATAFWFLVCAALVVLVIGTGCSPLFPNMFRVAAAVRGEVQVALGIALLLTVLTLPLDIFAAIVNGCRRATSITFAETVVRVLIFVLIFILFQNGARLDVLAGIQLVGKSIVWVIAFATARRLEPNWSVRFRNRRRARLGEIMRYGGQTTVINVSGAVIEKLDSVVIATVLGARMVTVYVIGQSLVQYLGQGVSAITLALTPFFADLHAKDDAERSRWLILAGTRAASLITGVITGGLLASARRSSRGGSGLSTCRAPGTSGRTRCCSYSSRGSSRASSRARPTSTCSGPTNSGICRAPSCSRGSPTSCSRWRS